MEHRPSHSQFRREAEGRARGKGEKGLPLPGEPASLETALLDALPVASTCTSSTFSCCGIYLGALLSLLQTEDLGTKGTREKGWGLVLLKLEHASESLRDVFKLTLLGPSPRDLGWDLRVCICHKLPGDADGVSP